MKTFDEFVNEGLLSNFFGKLFKNVMGIFDEDTKKTIGDATADIDKSKKFTDFTNILNETSNIQYNKIDKLTNIKEVYIFVKSDIAIINVLLKTASKKYGLPNVSPNILYKDSKNNILKNMFLVNKTFKNDEEYQLVFKNNLDQMSKEMLIQIASKCGIKKEDVESGINTEEVKESKLYEATEEQQNFEKLLEETRKFHTSIFKPLNDKLKMIDTTTKKIGNFDEFSKTFKATKNTDSIKKIINKLPDIDKAKLIKVRDVQGLTKDEAPI